MKQKRVKRSEIQAFTRFFASKKEMREKEETGQERQNSGKKRKMRAAPAA